jgi:peptidyl-prolyl cis-trans isomerase SurA
LALIIACGLTIMGARAQQQARIVDYIVAVVGDNVITSTELEDATRSAAEQLAAQGTQLPPQNVLARQVLERLIIGQLQQAAADEAGIQVDDQTLNTTLAQIASRNGVSLDVLRQTIESEGYSYKRFREDIRRDLIATRLRERMVNTRINVTDQEVEEFLEREGVADTRSVRLQHILIGLPEGASPETINQARADADQVIAELRGGADFGRVAASISDGANALEGGDLGWRTTAELPVAFADAIRPLSPGGITEPIRSPSGFHVFKVVEVASGGRRVVDQTHARHILIAPNEVVSDDEARLRLDRLRARILGGESFEELARANSDDKASSVSGGDLGWSSPGSFVPVFEEQMAAIPVGQISQPFKSPYGWHILQVLERREHDSTEDFLRSQAREALFERKSEEEWQLWLRRLRDEAYVEYRRPA